MKEPWRISPGHICNNGSVCIMTVDELWKASYRLKWKAIMINGRFEKTLLLWPQGKRSE